MPVKKRCFPISTMTNQLYAASALIFSSSRKRLKAPNLSRKTDGMRMEGEKGAPEYIVSGNVLRQNENLPGILLVRGLCQGFETYQPLLLLIPQI
jgi:hypothetical protein